MKRFCCLVLCAALVLTVATSFFGCAGDVGETTYFRIHIRANSNEAGDQSVKYAVRDRVVAFLTPELKCVSSFEAAVETVESQLHRVEAVADAALCAAGYGYRSRASVREEDFPTRKYDDLVLPSGRYRALIVELGSGAGDNWWCVAYPPLCFGGKGNYKIKSKIVEFFESLF